MNDDHHAASDTTGHKSADVAANDTRDTRAAMHETIAQRNQVDQDIAKFQTLLASLTSSRDAIEREHAQRAASTPLALRLEIVGCEYAAERYPTGPDASNIPHYVWGDQRCPFGKTTPDQDCRACPHHTVTPLGVSEPAHTRRYPAHGAIIPLSDAQARDLAHYLVAHGAMALRSVDSEIAAVALALAAAMVQRNRWREQPATQGE